MKLSKNFNLAQIAFLSSISVISMLVLRFPIILSANFLMFDLSLVPILFACAYLGFSSCFTIIIIVSLIQTFLFSLNGIVGSFMYFFNTSLIVLFFHLFNIYNKTLFKKLLILILILILTILLILPLDYIIFIYLYLMPQNAAINLLFSAVLPFNLIKLSSNIIVSILIVNLFKNKIRL